MRILGQNSDPLPMSPPKHNDDFLEKCHIDFDYILVIYGENPPKRICMRSTFRVVTVRELGVQYKVLILSKPALPTEKKALFFVFINRLLSNEEEPISLLRQRSQGQPYTRKYKQCIYSDF
jgi:hypothetical protein